ncbi:MAG: transglutaminase domain-containing protein [Ardenticatenaceae bacterium]|nr:transglutaminase domain-containing protein [Ardenticatenaceae bacterium]
MVADLAGWAWNRFRPQEGWLVLAATLALIACVVGAVLEVGWTPEANVVEVTAVGGFLLALLLAKRPVSQRLAWTILALYGLVVTFLILASLLPPAAVLRGGWWETSTYWKQNGALFLDRAASWFVAVFQGNASQETIIFSAGLALAAWFLTAYTAWTIFRQRRPLLGLTALGLALALNNYFGLAEMWWLAVFVGLAVLLATLVHYVTLEERWQRSGIDYSAEIRLELTIFGSAMAVCLLMFSMILPAFSISKLAEAFRNHPLVKEVENTLEDAFAGVEQPRQTLRSPGAPGGSGLLPRTYLLGNPPELAAQVMMTATVEIAGPDDQWTPATGDMLTGAHWRALSYDVYTGRGWALTQEREEPVLAGQPIGLPEVAGQTEVRQTLHWLADERLIRYTIGQPLAFDHDVTVHWRGLDDLSRVMGMPTEYQAVSRLTTAVPAALRETAVNDIPATIMARYTQLPDNLPERIPALAQEIAGNLDNPYDQARALEQFLRQYPYSLDVDLPPPDQDPVDFFLFDLQSGYCDYYASAMAVMARSLGLPARMAVGYLAQPPDESGVQQVVQLDSHSWPEIYFAGYGWVEFEPTAAFPSPHAGTPLFNAPESRYTPEPPLPQTAVPPRQPVPRPIPWASIGLRLGVVALLAALGFWLWRRSGREPGGDKVVWAYGRLQQQAEHLGQPAPHSQTPTEFGQALQLRLAAFARHARLASIADRLQQSVARLTDLYNTRRYSPPARQESRQDEMAMRTWRGMKRPLWLLRLAKKLMK